MNDTDLAIVAKPAPLDTGVGGVVRVSGTRVTLDTVVAAFKEGATAEEIVYWRGPGAGGPGVVHRPASAAARGCIVCSSCSRASGVM